MSGSQNIEYKSSWRDDCHVHLYLTVINFQKIFNPLLNCISKSFTTFASAKLSVM